MRVADRHGRPLSQVLSEYPDWEMSYWAAWGHREPTDGAKVEAILARFFSSWIGAHSKKGRKIPSPSELVYPSYWCEQRKSDNSDSNAITSALMRSGVKIKFGKRNNS